MLSFEQFWASVADALALDLVEIDRAASLSDDLSFDSIDMAELVVLMDELDCRVPEDLVGELETAGDVYAHYCTATARRAGVRRP